MCACAETLRQKRANTRWQRAASFRGRLFKSLESMAADSVHDGSVSTGLRLGFWASLDARSTRTRRWTRPSRCSGLERARPELASKHARCRPSRDRLKEWTTGTGMDEGTPMTEDYSRKLGASWRRPGSMLAPSCNGTDRAILQSSASVKSCDRSPARPTGPRLVLPGEEEMSVLT
jgi:hypothetical protein